MVNSMATSPGTNASYSARLRGRFSGILKWKDLDALWERINTSGEPWYLYQIGTEPPETPATGEPLATALHRLDELLHTDHHHDYCGIVYADDCERPTLVKIYDPNNLGASCGSSGRLILPRWVLSLQKSEEIHDPAPLPNNRRRWWRRLLGA